MKYIYGPVQSRRLGLSLGVSLTPYKICNFDCVYCQLGRTTDLSIDRKEYLPVAEILEELRTWLSCNPQEAHKLDYITLSGFGEPTLNSRVEHLIFEIKKFTSVPVALITNASLLADASVRKAVLQADLIVPSLDAVTPKVFARIDRPHQDIKIENVIAGLAAFRKEFRGKIWLEVMLVRGMNDDLRHIQKLKEVIEAIRPDKVQLNSPVRASAEQKVFCAQEKKLKKIKGILGENCEVF